MTMSLRRSGSMGVISLNAAIGSLQQKRIGFELSDRLHGKYLCRSRETCPKRRLDAICAIMPPQVSGDVPLKVEDSVLAERVTRC